MKKINFLLAIALLLAFSTCTSPAVNTPAETSATATTSAETSPAASTSPAAPKDVIQDTPSPKLPKAWVFNRNGLALYDGIEGPEIGIVPFNAEMQIDSVTPGWTRVLRRGNYLWVKEGNLSEQKLAPWEEIAALQLAERYQKWFRDFGTWEEVSEPYETEYRIKGMDISRSRAYNLLKLFLTKEESEMLPRDLPAGKFEREGENFEVDIETDKEKEETAITFFYPGGVTTGKISAEKEGLQISISFSAD